MITLISFEGDLEVTDGLGSLVAEEELEMKK